MLDYSELTVVKNSDGIPTALGYPINSFMLQNNKPLFVGGGGRKGSEYENLAVPAGLVCMTETRCMRSDAYANEIDTNEIDTNEIDTNEIDTIEDEREIVPEGLYERLMELAEVKERKKMTKRNKKDDHKNKKNKTHKRK
jgi:hypothetical protein